MSKFSVGSKVSINSSALVFEVLDVAGCLCQLSGFGGTVHENHLHPLPDSEPVSDLTEKLERKIGLCTSVAHNDKENLRRIRFILSAWERGVPLEYAPRATTNDWKELRHLPTDFNLVYRASDC